MGWVGGKQRKVNSSKRRTAEGKLATMRSREATTEPRPESCAFTNGSSFTFIFQLVQQAALEVNLLEGVCVCVCLFAGFL